MPDQWLQKPWHQHSLHPLHPLHERYKSTPHALRSSKIELLFLRRQRSLSLSIHRHSLVEQNRRQLDLDQRNRLLYKLDYLVPPREPLVQLQRSDWKEDDRSSSTAQSLGSKHPVNRRDPQYTQGYHQEPELLWFHPMLGLYRSKNLKLPKNIVD